MAARPIAESGIEILNANAVGRELLVALVHQERAIKGRRFDRGSYWRRLGHPLRQGFVAEPLRKVVHRWPEDQRLNRWHGDRGWRRSLRRGWPSELKTSRGLGGFSPLLPPLRGPRRPVPTTFRPGPAQKPKPPAPTPPE